ncbi:MAG: hypothetical protein AAF458_12705 [Pseudomonadota bacterium]
MSNAHQPHDTIAALVLSPDFANDATLFASVRNSLLRSADGGDSWTPLTNGVWGRVRQIALAGDYASTGRVYAVVAGQGVLRSDDRGERFATLSRDVKHASPAPFAVAAAGRDDRLYRLDRKGRLHRSDDRGGRWTADATNAGLPVERVFSAGGVTLIVTAASTLFVRDEVGSPGRWRHVGERPGNADIMAFARAADGALLIGTGAGIYRLHADGAWRLAPLTGELAVTSIAPASSDPRHWLATSRQHAVLRSTDDGRTWRRIGFGMRKYRQADAYGVPHFSSVAQAADGQAFLASFGGLFRSDQSLQLWQSLATLDDHTVVAIDADVAASGRTMLLVSTYLAGTALLMKDTDGAWQSRLLRPAKRRGGIALFLRNGDGDQPRIIVASASSTLHYSDDLGTTWTASRMPARMPGHRKYPDAVTGIWPAPDGRTLFAGHRPLGLLRSNDNGDGFERVWDGAGQSVWSVAVSPSFATDNTLFATTHRALHRSTDGARTFALVREVKHRRPDVFISSRFRTTRRVWVTDRRMLVSEDAGVSWRRFLPALLPGPLARAGFANHALANTGELLLVQPAGGRLLQLRLPTDAAVVGTREPGPVWRPELPPHAAFAQVHSSGRDRSTLITFSPQFRPDDTIFAASDRRVFMSADRGRQWRQLPVPLHVHRDSKQVRYAGRWWSEHQLAGAHSGAMLSSDPAASITFTFNGTGVEWTCIQLPQGRTEVEVRLDGVALEMVSVQSAQPDLDGRCHVSSGLERGQHRLEIRARGDGAASVVAHRAFVVTP